MATTPSISWRNAWGRQDAISAEARAYVYGVRDNMGRSISVGVRDRAIVLRDVETDKLLILPYFTRFSDRYYRQAIKRLRRLKSRDAVFLTLTVDPNCYSLLAHARRGLAVGFNRLLAMLRKRFEKRLNYVAVVEFTKEGVPHLHALFFGLTRLMDADELRDFWNSRYHVGKIVHIVKIRNDAAQVVAYLTKYMAKALVMPELEFSGPDGLVDAKSWMNLSLAWSLNLRCYSCSRGILDNPRRTSQTLGGELSPSNWKLLGSFAMIDVEGWIGRSYPDIYPEYLELKGDWDGWKG